MRWGALVVLCGCGIGVEGIGAAPPAPDDAGVKPTTQTDGGKTTDPPPKNDGGVVDSGPTDAGGGKDAGLPPGCVAGDAFDFDGLASAQTRAPGAVTLKMTKDQRVALSHAFPAPKAYTRSKLELLIDMHWDNTWGGGSGDYVPFLHQWFGLDDKPTSWNDVVFAQNGLEAHIHPGTGTQGLGSQPVPNTKNVTVLAETTWSDSNATGRLKVTTAPTEFHNLQLATAETGATATALYVELGGTAKGTIPDLTFTIYRACVTFDP